MELQRVGTPKPSLMLLGLSIAFGIATRFLSASAGDNFDMESWWIASEACVAGDIVYARTHRYNYGPVWFWIIGGLRDVSAMTGADSMHRLHLFMTGFLTLVDLGIAALLYTTITPIAGILFFLNPISLATTGYHIQFDNFAIFTGLVAWILFTQATSRRDLFVSALLFGLSLSIKHIFLLFVGWLPFLTNARSTADRFWFGAIALTLFFGSFSPWLNDPQAWEGIRANVFGYHSTEGHSLTSHLAQLLPGVPARTLFMILTLSTGALLARTQRLHRCAPHLYLIALTALSSGMARNYLAIPLVGIFAFGFTRSGSAYLAVASVIFVNVTTALGTHEVVADLFSLPVFTYELAQALLLALLVEVARPARDRGAPAAIAG
jgi:hypothetical protein